MIFPFQISGSIVSYNNNSAQIVSAVQSFMSSSLRVALTVIDNSSTQDLRSVVTEAGAEYCSNRRNIGFGAGHNIAIRKYSHQSQYHLILNPDVSFGPDVLVTLYDFMQSNPDTGLLMPRIIYPGGAEQYLCKLLPSPFDLLIRRFGGTVGRRLFRAKLDKYLLINENLTKPTVVPSLSGCFMLIRSSVFDEIGFFDERFFLYMEDVDLCRRIGAISKTIYFPDVTVSHEYQKGSYYDFRLMKFHLESAWAYFNKWGWFVDKTRDSLNKRDAKVGRAQFSTRDLDGNR
jgi:GT2 family glycosyltransferase